MVGKREGDWLDFVADLLAAPLTRWPDEQVARMLIATLGAPAGAFYVRAGANPPVQRQWPPEHFAEHQDEIARWTEQEAPSRHPVLRYYIATGDCHPMQVADVPERFAGRRVQAGWREWCRSIGDGVENQLSVPLLVGPRANRSFVVGRSDPYTAGEMVLCRRLQRLLVGLDRQVTAFARWSARSGPGALDVAEAVRLTPRELAVLELLASGLTALSIARRLRITERTVQKHLQHVYAKLGVVDRLGAVLRAQHVGLLSTQFPSLGSPPDAPFY